MDKPKNKSQWIGDQEQEAAVGWLVGPLGMQISQFDEKKQADNSATR